MVFKKNKFFPKFKNFFKNYIQLSRYILSGCFFTIFAPSLFLILSSYMPTRFSFIISDFLIQVLRFNILTIWVFESRINRNSLKAYLKATIPTSFINFFLVSILSPFISRFYLAIIIGIFSASAGYLWSKFCYLKIQKNQDNWIILIYGFYNKYILKLFKVFKKQKVY